MIGRIRIKWTEHGYQANHGGDEQEERPWYEAIVRDVSKSMLNIDHSVEEFNKSADKLAATFGNLDEIRHVILHNLRARSPGNETTALHQAGDDD